MTIDKRPAVQNIIGFIALLASAAGGGGITLARHHHEPPIEFVDLQRLVNESIPGRAATADYQRGAADRQRRVLEASDAAAKLAAGSKERQAKEAEAQQLGAQVQQQNQAAAHALDDDFRKKLVTLLEQMRPGIVVLPVRPLTGGRDLTDEVILRMNAANEDAERKLKARDAEIEQLRKQLAERPGRPAPPPLTGRPGQ